eukprot:scaffold2091_cov20-Prasinocladus_malaysianus.AAC.1
MPKITLANIIPLHLGQCKICIVKRCIPCLQAEGAETVESLIDRLKSALVEASHDGSGGTTNQDAPILQVDTCAPPAS